tara:strand:- start:399 stop:602 length:204 start_codon:yes stop_codon:yes gene_type:complete
MATNSYTGLTDSDMVQLAELGKLIQLGLSCDANGEGVPCRTDRLDVVANMIKYLQLHDYTITNEVSV